MRYIDYSSDTTTFENKEVYGTGSVEGYLLSGARARWWFAYTDFIRNHPYTPFIPFIEDEMGIPDSELRQEIPNFNSFISGGRSRLAFHTAATPPTHYEIILRGMKQSHNPQFVGALLADGPYGNLAHHEANLGGIRGDGLLYFANVTVVGSRFMFAKLLYG